MRALILSDIHSNLTAFRAVIADAENRGGFDVIWCLGDTVGYGPDPRECLKLLRSYKTVVVAGNHDYAAVGKMSVETFNYAAAAATRWTTEQLSPQEADFLAKLPEMVTVDPFTLVHGSLRVPLMEYILEPDSALGTFELLNTRFCLVGHSHIPFLCLENQGQPQFVEFTEDVEFELDDQRRIINPGGVGQPRDRDPRPSYAIYDSQRSTISRHRVTYDIGETQKRMRKAQLPQPLIERLNHGF